MNALTVVNRPVFSWAVNPTISILHKIGKTLELSISKESSSISIEEYVLKNGPNLDSYQLSEVMTYSARRITQLKSKKSQSDKSREQNALEYGIMLSKDMIQTMKLLRSSTIKVNEYGVFHWLTPISSIEIFLLSALEINSKDFFGRSVFSKNEFLVLNLEKALVRLSEHERDTYKLEIMELKKELISLRDRRSSDSISFQ